MRIKLVLFMLFVFATASHGHGKRDKRKIRLYKDIEDKTHESISKDSNDTDDSYEYTDDYYDTYDDADKDLGQRQTPLLNDSQSLNNRMLNSSQNITNSVSHGYEVGDLKTDQSINASTNQLDKGIDKVTDEDIDESTDEDTSEEIDEDEGPTAPPHIEHMLILSKLKRLYERPTSVGVQGD